MFLKDLGVSNRKGHQKERGSEYLMGKNRAFDEKTREDAALREAMLLNRREIGFRIDIQLG